jgi:hypothetical protein
MEGNRWWALDMLAWPKISPDLRKRRCVDEKRLRIWFL